MINKNYDEEVNNITYLYDSIKKELLQLNNDRYYITDVLIKYLYKFKKSSYKTTLWECFGNIIVDNLKNNIDESLKDGYVQCEICGERIEDSCSTKKYCEKCAKKINIQKTIDNRKAKKCLKRDEPVKLTLPTVTEL